MNRFRLSQISLFCLLTLFVTQTSSANFCFRGSEQDPDILCPGDTVLEVGGAVGVVKSTFADETTEVQFEGESKARRVKNKAIGKSIECFNGRCEGDYVIDSEDQIGLVELTFSNSWSLLKLETFDETIAVENSDLFDPVQCIKKFCQGSRIKDSSENLGTIVDLFLSGVAKVKYDELSRNFVESVEDLILVKTPQSSP